MKTILLIDDDEGMLHSYGLLLRKSGYRVLEASSGSLGFEMARQHLPDLILSDIDMPGGDGASLLREIRRDSDLKSVQVVLMTGTAELLLPSQGIEDEADASLVKPISLQELLSCVKAQLNRDPLRQPAEDQLVA